MKNLLRFVFAALAAMAGFGASADEVTVAAGETLEVSDTKSDKVMNYTVYGELLFTGYGGRDELDKSGSTVVVKDGGTLNLKCNGNYDAGITLNSGASITVEKGGQLLESNTSLIGRNTAGLIYLDGGSLSMKSTSVDNNDYLPYLQLANGATITGGTIGFGWATESWGARTGYLSKMSVTGTSPSYINTDKMYLGGCNPATLEAITNAGKTISNVLGLELTVNEVSDDDASDLIVNAEVVQHSSLVDWPADQYQIEKKGAGTVEFTKTVGSTMGLKISEGTVKLSGAAKIDGPTLLFNGGTLDLGATTGNNPAAISVTADSTLKVGEGSVIALNSLTVAEGVKLTIDGDLTLATVTSGALDEDTLGKIVYNGVAGTLSVTDGRLLPAGGTLTVTFVGLNGETLKTEEVEMGEDATAPEAPAVEGYRFTGWDKEYTAIVRNTTVTARYVKVWTVVFYGYDRVTVLSSQTIDEGTDATPPEAPAVEGYRFTGWDGTYTEVAADECVYAIYKAAGDLDDEAAAALAAKGVGYVWNGGANGTWDGASANWLDKSGAAAAWADGETAAIAYDASVTLSGDKTVAGLYVNGDATIGGGDTLTFADGAKVEFNSDSQVTIDSGVAFAGSFTQAKTAMTELTAPALTMADQLLFPGVQLKLIATNTMSLVACRERDNGGWSSTGTLNNFYYRSAATGNYGHGDGIYEFTMAEDGESASFEVMVGVYNYDHPFGAKVVLTQQDDGVHGYVERVRYLLTGYVYDWRTSLDDETMIADTAGAPEVTLLTTTDAVLAFTEKYAMSITDWKVKFNPCVYTDATKTVVNGEFTDDNTITVNVGDFVLNGTATLGGQRVTADGGRIVIGSDGDVVFNNEKNSTDTLVVKGKLTVNARAALPNNAGSTTVENGGDVTFNFGGYYENGVSGSAPITIMTGGVVRVTRTQQLGTNKPFTLDGGELVSSIATTDYKMLASPKSLTLKDGARISGTVFGLGVSSYSHANTTPVSVEGTTPSYIASDALVLGRDENLADDQSNKRIEGGDMTVNDVTGDAASDLVISAKVVQNGAITITEATRAIYGFIKKGAGTLEFANELDFDGTIYAEAGTIKFTGAKAMVGETEVGMDLVFTNGNAKVDFGTSENTLNAIDVAEDATVNIERGAKITASSLTVAEGKKITLTGTMGKQALKVTTALDADTLARIKYVDANGNEKSVTQDAEGYICPPGAGLVLIIR